MTMFSRPHVKKKPPSNQFDTTPSSARSSSSASTTTPATATSFTSTRSVSSGGRQQHDELLLQQRPLHQEPLPPPLLQPKPPIKKPSRNVKVLPILHHDHAPEMDADDECSTLKTATNQHEMHAGPGKRQDGSLLHLQLHLPVANSCESLPNAKGKAKKKKRIPSRGGPRSFRSTLQSTRTTAANFVRVASSRALKRSDRYTTTTTAAATTTGARAGNEEEALDLKQPPATDNNHEMGASNISKAMTMSMPTTTMTIHPADAWKHLLLAPTSRFWVVWNLLHLLALGYICTIVPYLTALPDGSKEWSDGVNRAIDVFYIVDVGVNFRACYIDSERGEIVTDAMKIAHHYMASSKAWFIFDLVMAFPFDFILASSSDSGSAMAFTFVRILRLLRLAKLLRILKLRPMLDFCEDSLAISRNKLVVVQLLATIAFVAHLTACGFILAAATTSSSSSSSYSASTAAAWLTGGGTETREHSRRSSWIEVNDLVGAPPGEIYVAALYWAFTMMTTVGFGDIVPVTLAERMYSILAMVISAGTYAYVIASMSTIVALMNVQQSRYYEKINELNAYMGSRQLPPALQLRTRQFYRYYLTKKTVFDELALCDALPMNLKEELVEHHVTTAMHHIIFFHELTERGFIGQVALFLRPVYFPPLSVIVKAHDHATEMFFISKGSFQVITSTSTTSHDSSSPAASPGRSSHETPVPQRAELSGSPLKKSIAKLLSPRRAGATADHHHHTVAVLRDGDYFGEMALLCDAPRHRRFASVESQTYCELHTLSYTALAPALDKYLSVWKKLHRQAISRKMVLENLHRTKIEHLLATGNAGEL